MKRRVLLQLSAMALILSMLLIPGVHALWIYNEVNTTLPAAPLSAQVPLSLNFSWGSWSGEEELPPNMPGQNHAVLIDSLISEGLNVENSALNNAIEARSGFWHGFRDTFGSMDNGWYFGIGTGGDEATENIDIPENAKDLTFIIQWEDSNTYQIYTTNLDLGTNGNPNFSVDNKTPIYEIYRTTVVKENGAWVPKETVLGWAPSDYYEESTTLGIGGSNRNEIPSFDVSQFQEGKLGTGINDAIRVYDGYSNYLYPDTSATSTYFRFNNAEAGTSYNFTVAIAQTATPNISMTLYNSAGTAEGAPTLNSITTQQETVTNDDGTTTTRTFYVYSFTCTRQSAGEFYFSVKGDLAMWFRFEKATN